MNFLGKRNLPLFERYAKDMIMAILGGMIVYSLIQVNFDFNNIVISTIKFLFVLLVIFLIIIFGFYTLLKIDDEKKKRN